ncbi:hypothetical protein 3 [Hubei tombus-like virus 25]|uniref:hypothetical protein 3 n=1 Tax=Hubei tombus-like virus 25 TaxID=1923272 RepID=UPI00090CD7C1|nr:hypothetical protein 3 [Hubei tombus-like virus 25]APG76499.1 hypothetical protein 3 [Hubei tombus-like virus 25]
MNVTIQQKKGSTSKNKQRSKKKRNNKTSRNPLSAKASKGTAKANTAPVSINVTTKKGIPAIKSTAGGITVTHKEYIGDFTSNGASFALNNYNVNPGLSGTFPWLSAIANRYESYLIDDLHFIYEPICPTTTPGSILMAMDYDAADSAPSNKVTIMAYSSAVRTSPWNRTVFAARRSDLHKFGVQRYVRSTVPPTNTDVKTYDVGNFFLASQGTPAGPTPLGELYVSYTIRFLTPQVGTGILAPSTVMAAESQSTILRIPAGVAAVNLSGEYRGSGVNPLAWLEPLAATTPDPVLLLNLNNANNMLLSFRAENGWGGSAAGWNPLAFFQNMRMGTSVTDIGVSWAVKQLAFGFAEKNDPNSLFQTYLIQPTMDALSKSQGGIFPLILKRPATGTYQMAVALMPVAANYSGNIPQITQMITDWAFPQLYIPTFNASLLTKAGMRASFTDTLNTIHRADPQDTVSMIDDLETKVKTKLKW